MSQTAVGQTREREVQLPSFHIYQEERMLILQIFDNVFPASVIPNLLATPQFGRVEQQRKTRSFAMAVSGQEEED